METMQKIQFQEQSQSKDSPGALVTKLVFVYVSINNVVCDNQISLAKENEKMKLKLVSRQFQKFSPSLSCYDISRSPIRPPKQWHRTKKSIWS
jgi:hypothetical protein